MGRFYETTFFDASQGLIGLHVLTSPAEIAGERIEYSRLFDDTVSIEISVENRQVIISIIAMISRPEVHITQRLVKKLLTVKNEEYRIYGPIQQLLQVDKFAAEASPVEGRTLYEFVECARTCHVVWSSRGPILVLVSNKFGLAVVGGLTLIGGAIGKGFLSAVSKQSEDITTQMLEMIRARLKPKKRRKSRR